MSGGVRCGHDYPVDSTTCPSCKAIGTHTATCPRSCPVGTTWCTEHIADWGQCVSDAIDISPRLSVWLLLEGPGEPARIAVDCAPGFAATLAEATGLQSALGSLLRTGVN